MTKAPHNHVPYQPLQQHASKASLQTKPNPPRKMAPSPSCSTPSQKHTPPILFLDIDGVLNTTKHNTQIHMEPIFLTRLQHILESTGAFVVLTTFWRHFHEYITYVFHRHGIDAGRMLPLPAGATRGRQCTKKFLRHYHLRQRSSGLVCDEEGLETSEMIGRSAEDEGEYSSRAEEIETWLQVYGKRYLGSADDKENYENEKRYMDECSDEYKDQNNSFAGYEFHPTHWKYAILDDRPSAAKPGTPLFERFVLTQTKLGLTEQDVEKVIDLLLNGPKASS